MNKTIIKASIALLLMQSGISQAASRWESFKNTYALPTVAAIAAFSIGYNLWQRQEKAIAKASSDRFMALRDRRKQAHYVSYNGLRSDRYTRAAQAVTGMVHSSGSPFNIKISGGGGCTSSSLQRIVDSMLKSSMPAHEGDSGTYFVIAGSQVPVTEVC